MGSIITRQLASAAWASASFLAASRMVGRSRAQRLSGSLVAMDRITQPEDRRQLLHDRLGGLRSQVFRKAIRLRFCLIASRFASLSAEPTTA